MMFHVFAQEKAVVSPSAKFGARVGNDGNAAVLRQTLTVTVRDLRKRPGQKWSLWTRSALR